MHEILSGIGGAIVASGGWYFVACRYDRTIDGLREEIIAADQALHHWFAESQASDKRVGNLAITASRAMLERNQYARELEQERAAKQGRDALGKFAAKVRA